MLSHSSEPVDSCKERLLLWPETMALWKVEEDPEAEAEAELEVEVGAALEDGAAAVVLGEGEALVVAAAEDVVTAAALVDGARVVGDPLAAAVSAATEALVGEAPEFEATATSFRALSRPAVLMELPEAPARAITVEPILFEIEVGVAPPSVMKVVCVCPFSTYSTPSTDTMAFS